MSPDLENKTDAFEDERLREIEIRDSDPGITAFRTYQRCMRHGCDYPDGAKCPEYDETDPCS